MREGRTRLVSRKVNDKDTFTRRTLSVSKRSALFPELLCPIVFPVPLALCTARPSAPRAWNLTTIGFTVPAGPGICTLWARCAGSARKPCPVRSVHSPPRTSRTSDSKSYTALQPRSEWPASSPDTARVRHGPCERSAPLSSLSALHSTHATLLRCASPVQARRPPPSPPPPLPQRLVQFGLGLALFRVFGRAREPRTGKSAAYIERVGTRETREGHATLPQSCGEETW